MNHTNLKTARTSIIYFINYFIFQLIVQETYLKDADLILKPLKKIYNSSMLSSYKESQLF